MALLLVAGLALAPVATAAGAPLDTFGFGARAAGLAGATTADTTGAAATHANPAGVALGTRTELLLGWGYAAMALDLQGSDAGVLDAHGTDLGLAIPFELGRGVRAGIGLSLHLPDSFLARIQLVPATEPRFVILDNDAQRTMLEPVVALRPTPWLSLGAGASLFTDAAGDGITFDVGVSGGEQVGAGTVDASLPARAAPLLGLIVLPHPRVSLAATYRGEIDLDLSLDVVANVIVPAVEGDVLIGVRATNFFTPRRATAAATVAVSKRLTVSGELAWLGWSEFEGGVPDLRLLVELGISPPLVETYFPAEHFRDTLVPRLGVEWRRQARRLGLALRAGYAFEPTPVPDQTGVTSFADNDRDVIAIGGGVALDLLRPIIERPVRLDLGLQWHHLRDRLTIKDQAAFPGVTLASDGEIVRAAATMTVEL